MENTAQPAAACVEPMTELDWLRKDKKELSEMLDVAKDTLIHERQMRVNVEREKRDALKEIDRLEAEVHDRDMAIMELKAKLYDLMAEKEEK